MSSNPTLQAVRVWDRFVRIVHWTLVSCVLTNYFVLDDGETVHQWLGYLAGALVAARIVWGFIGSEHARFANFMPTRSRLSAHLSRLRAGQYDRHLGHNPLGAVMMLALMVLILTVAASGFLQTTDALWGEEWVQDLHEALAGLLIGFAVIHGIAAIVMSRLEGVNLIGAMITGVQHIRTQSPLQNRQSEPRKSSVEQRSM
ncbi:cytochrome b/b6 domain-containing protein [Pseudothauera hydrothermalis]|uniref:cytochrome b/b6 domain-containing protein n=1 Tax=Pseudothauera hydrothermalis TaxID=2184083 RepID=UPI000E09354D|nr:cytochrome b/b6 domain-containing protein [Pseudothauera hydrothermalis]